MTTVAVIEGIQILNKYRDKQGYDLGAEHDVIYCFSTDRPVSEEDIVLLRSLGWTQEEVPEDDDGNPGPYDPEQGWAIYV